MGWQYIQPWCTSFPIWNQSVVPCPIQTVPSWPAYRFLRRWVRWSGIPVSWRIFHIFLWSTQRLWCSQQSRFFSWSSCFFDPMDVCNLNSGSSDFSKSSFNLWRFSVYVRLKPGLENFEHYFTSVWDECNCAVVWTFFGTDCLWDWNENFGIGIKTLRKPERILQRNLYIPWQDVLIF